MYNSSSLEEEAGAGSQMTMIKELNFEELNIGRVIGEGSFGIVYFSVWRGMHVAVKALKITEGFSALASRGSEPPGSGTASTSTGTTSSSSCSSDAEFLRHEAKLMARVCNHDHVIQFVGIVVHPSPCVVTIFCSKGSVEDLLVTSEDRHAVERACVLRMALEAARGVRHLHLEGVIHRDLAARNLLLDSNLRVRVGDFGFSRVKAAAASKGYTKSDMGPIRWLAPEAMRRKMYSEASDVFSFGVVLYEMFYRCVPWADFDTLDVAIRVCSGERMEVRECAAVPGGLLGLVEACWCHSAQARPALGEVIACLEGLQLQEEEVVGKEESPCSGGQPGQGCISSNEYSLKLGNDAADFSFA
jgi:serine/threonine protein kinase